MWATRQTENIRSNLCPGRRTSGGRVDETQHPSIIVAVSAGRKFTNSAALSSLPQPRVVSAVTRPLAGHCRLNTAHAECSRSLAFPRVLTRNTREVCSGERGGLGEEGAGRVFVCVCVCVRERERERVCVMCVCVCV